MLIVYTSVHTGHNPVNEILDGRFVPYQESPIRVERIRTALEAAGHGPVVPPRSFGLTPVLAVHDAAYVDYLEHAYARWVAAGGTPAGVLPSTFAGRGMQRPAPHPLALPGYYAYDQSVVIVPGTYAAARASADVALTGAALLLEGQAAVYALCRPPGHHAGYDNYGGYCVLNNVAIAAHHLAQANGFDVSSVAILDIDFHHGNGTQAIFYERADVLFVSIHADPVREYPYFTGYADEQGAGAGAGYTLNIPLEAGVDNVRYLEALDTALEAIRRYAPRWLLVSVGFDTRDQDPLGDFQLTAEVYASIGAQLAALGVPTLFVQEGGYAIEHLGETAVSLLTGFSNTWVQMYAGNVK